PAGRHPLRGRAQRADVALPGAAAGALPGGPRPRRLGRPQLLRGAAGRSRGRGRGPPRDLRRRADVGRTARALGHAHLRSAGRRKDGSLYWARVSLSPLRDEQGRITGARSIAQDITELRQAQQAVRESEARLSAIIQFALDPIIVTDQEGRIVLINPAGERVF